MTTEPLPTDDHRAVPPGYAHISVELVTRKSHVLRSGHVADLLRITAELLGDSTSVGRYEFQQEFYTLELLGELKLSVCIDVDKAHGAGPVMLAHLSSMVNVIQEAELVHRGPDWYRNGEYLTPPPRIRMSSMNAEGMREKTCAYWANVLGH